MEACESQQQLLGDGLHQELCAVYYYTTGFRLKLSELPITSTIQQYHLIFLSAKELTPEATTINCKIIPFIMTYESIFFSATIANIW